MRNNRAIFILSVLFLSLLLFSGSAYGQTIDPDAQPEITAPAASDAFYTQERGPLNKIRLDTLRGYYAPNIVNTAKAYTPGSGTIPAADRYQIIKGSDGLYYYIDKDKDYVLISTDSTVFATQTDLATYTDGDSSSTNELQTISKSGSTVTLSNGGGSFTDAVDDADASATNELQTISIDSSGTSFTITLSNSGGSVTFKDDEGSGSGLTDGDKGDITVSSSGTVWNIDADAVGAAEIATGAVGTTEIADGAVGTNDLAANAVTNSKIATDAVSTAQIAANAVGASEIATDAVGAAEIAANAVGASEIAANAVGSSELASTTVTAGSYTHASLTVDADGRLTAASSGTDSDNQNLSVTSTTLSAGFVQNEIEISGGTNAFTYDNDRQDLTIDSSGTSFTISIENGNSVTFKDDGGDNLGNHLATQNIDLDTNWISPDGTDRGISFNSTNDLEMRSNTSHAFFTFATGPTANTISSQASSGSNLVNPYIGFRTETTGDSSTLTLGTNPFVPTIALQGNQVIFPSVSSTVAQTDYDGIGIWAQLEAGEYRLFARESNNNKIYPLHTYTAVKTADETKTGGDTADGDLTLALDPGIYHVTVDLMWSSDATNGIEFDFGLSADFDGGYSLDRSANKETLIGWGTNQSINGSGSTIFLTHYRGILLVDGSSPDLTLSWGKLVSGDTGSAILKKGSTIRAEYVGAN